MIGSAQRRPEPGSRQHVVGSRSCERPTRGRSTKAGTGVPATRYRPLRRRAGPHRSTKAGTGVPATRSGRPSSGCTWRSLNEGRNRGPGNTSSRTSTRPRARSLNEGRNRGPGNTGKVGAPVVGRLRRSTKAGTGVPATRAGPVSRATFTSSAQRRPEPGSRQHRWQLHVPAQVQQRSTKAGTGVPATHLRSRLARPRPSTLNEGRNRGPGNTSTRATPTSWSTSLNEGRNRGPGNTSESRLTFDESSALNEGRNRGPGNTSGVLRVRGRRPSLNEGRNRGPGNTGDVDVRLAEIEERAQRRPEPGSRQHVAAASRSSASWPLNEGRNRGPGNTTGGA